MDIKRVDNYTDPRFSPAGLNQHGGYLISDEPYEVEIVSSGQAVVRGRDPALFPALVEEFRFHAPHIFRYVDERGALIAEYPPEKMMDIAIDLIQPSQFFVDEDKVRAVSSFIRNREDIIVQVMPWKDRYVSLDGHTRLYVAVQRGFASVQAVLSQSDNWVWKFVEEARRRGITSPKDLKLLPHNEYEEQWNRYCDTVFGQRGS